MPIVDFQQLECWQLANDLKKNVYALVDRTTARTDVKFCDQITSSAASAPSNIAEGFGHYVHGEAARYARIAKASLDETRNHLLDGVDRKHWTKADAEPLLLLAGRATGATTRWLAYLRSTPTPPASWEHRNKPKVSGT
jgi:four helix bundle protein